MYPVILYDKYAILGDDVIITDDKVAEQYAIAMALNSEFQLSVTSALRGETFFIQTSK